MSLGIRRRRVWVRAVAGDDGRTVVTVGGLATAPRVGTDDDDVRSSTTLACSRTTRSRPSEKELATPVRTNLSAQLPALNSATLVYGAAMVAFAYDFAFSARVDGAVEARPRRGAGRPPRARRGRRGARATSGAQQGRRHRGLADDPRVRPAPRRGRRRAALGRRPRAVGKHVRVLDRGRARRRRRVPRAAPAGLRWLGLFVITRCCSRSASPSPCSTSPAPSRSSPRSTRTGSRSTSPPPSSPPASSPSPPRSRCLYLVADRAERRIARGDEPGWAATCSPASRPPSGSTSSRSAPSRSRSRSGPSPSSPARSGPRTRGAGTGAGTRRRPGRSSPGSSTPATCTRASPPAGRAAAPRSSR